MMMQGKRSADFSRPPQRSGCVASETSHEWAASVYKITAGKFSSNSEAVGTCSAPFLFFVARISETHKTVASHVDRLVLLSTLLLQHCELLVIHIQVDSFAFSVLLWEIITKDRPARGQLYSIESPQMCPVEITQLVESGVSRNPAKRPSAAEVRHVKMKKIA